MDKNIEKTRDCENKAENKFAGTSHEEVTSAQTAQWFVVVNPSSGSGKTLKQWQYARSLMDSHGITYHFTTPESAEIGHREVLEACREGFRKFIAVGGDGTVHSILNCIMAFCEDTKLEDATHSALNNTMGTSGRTKDEDAEDAMEATVSTPPKTVSSSEFKLAVLPIGSGNDWLRSRGIPKNLEEIISLIAADSFALQDVGCAEILDPDQSEKASKKVYMANVGGYNFDANVCDIVNSRKTLGETGKLMYFKAIIEIAKNQIAAPTKILCDGIEVMNEDCYTISIGNGKYSGGGLVQTPDATMDDGVFDIMVAPRFAMWRLAFQVHRLLNGTVRKIPFIHFFRASSIEIIPATPRQHSESDKFNTMEPSESSALDTKRPSEASTTQFNEKGHNNSNERLASSRQLVEIDGEIIGRAPVRLTILPKAILTLSR